VTRTDAEFKVKVPGGSARVIVQNDTSWRTGDLCRIIRGAVKFEEVPAGRAVWAHIVYGRGGGSCSGLGWFRTGRIRVRVPSAASLAKGSGRFPAVDFAHVVAHEIGHAIFNLDHERMGFSYRRGPFSNKMFGWAAEIPVRPKTAPKRPSVDVKRVKRLEHAQAQVLRYERRLKLTETILKRWRKRVKDVERTLAKAAVEKGVGYGTEDGHQSGESRDPVSVLCPDGGGADVGE